MEAELMKKLINQKNMLNNLKKKLSVEAEQSQSMMRIYHKIYQLKKF